MNATKILWGQVLLVGFVVLAFLWGATEWVAWRLAFQPHLGRPWFEVFGWPLYEPPAFFWWWFAYDAYARDVFVEGAYIAASGGIAAVVVAIAMSVWRAREVKRVTTYGSGEPSKRLEDRPWPSHQSAKQHLDVDDVGLCPTRPPIHGRLEGWMT